MVCPSYDLPLPNCEYDGRIVIASMYADPEGLSAVLLLLNEMQPFYGVAEVDLRTLYNLGEDSHAHIMTAIAQFTEMGDH
jgi:hypothetical protein